MRGGAQGVPWVINTKGLGLINSIIWPVPQVQGRDSVSHTELSRVTGCTQVSVTCPHKLRNSSNHCPAPQVETEVGHVGLFCLRQGALTLVWTTVLIVHRTSKLRSIKNNLRKKWLLCLLNLEDSCWLT